MLESYRVILLQRPPALAAEDFTPVASLQTVERALPTLPRAIQDEQDSEPTEVIRLAELASPSWFVSPHGPSGFPNPALWKADFVEVALERWYSSHESRTSSDAWTTMLYHMVCLNMHSNIDLLQRHARLVAKTGRLPSQPAVFRSVDKWRNSRHYRICKSHADMVLAIDMSFSNQHRPAGAPRASSAMLYGSRKPSTHISEPPHVPFCIYYATLIIWYGIIGNTEQNTSTANVCLETGARLLFELKAHVATHLGRALHELLTH